MTIFKIMQDKHLTDNYKSCYTNTVKRKLASSEDAGYFDTIDPVIDGIKKKVPTTSNSDALQKASPFILMGVNKVKDKLSDSQRKKVISGLEDAVILGKSIKDKKGPYSAEIDADGNLYLHADKTSVPAQIGFEILDNTSTPKTRTLRNKVIGSGLIGLGLGGAALYLSTKNKRILKDTQFGSLLDSAASTLRQKDLQKLLGSAVLNNATVITTPLSGYYAYKNRDNPEKFSLGLGLMAANAGVYAKTHKYLYKNGPLIRSVNESLSRLKELYPNHPEVHKRLSSTFKNYLENANAADRFAAAATIPFMYGAENLNALQKQRALADLQGNTDFTNEARERKIKELKTQHGLLDKYPYLRGMPFAQVLSRHINK